MKLALQITQMNTRNRLVLEVYKKSHFQRIDILPNKSLLRKILHNYKSKLSEDN